MRQFMIPIVLIAGLGLAPACAKLHGGTLSLGDNHPGLRAVLEFPATASSDSHSLVV